MSSGAAKSFTQSESVGDGGMTAATLMAAYPSAGFNYDALPVLTAKTLRTQATRIRKLVKTTTTTIIEVGHDLIAVKRTLDHGQFGAWVEAECGFSLRTAENYIRAAEFAEGKSEIVSLLPPTTVYRLSSKSAPPDLVKSFIEVASRGDVVSERSVKDALEEARFQKRELKRQEEKEKSRSRSESKKRRAQREAEEERRKENNRLRAERCQQGAADIIQRLGLDDVRFLLAVLSEQDFWEILPLLRDLAGVDA